MDWKCEVSSCPRCALDVFKASSSVLDDNLSGGKVAVPIEGIRKALANVLKELGKTRVEDDGFPIKYMSFHGTLNKILNIHAPGELLVIIKSGTRYLFALLMIAQVQRGSTGNYLVLTIISGEVI